jgi:hypothetical protein
MTTNTPAPANEAVLNDTIREVFLAHGFTIKEGQTDLKPYVYDAVHALLSKLRAPVADEGVRTEALYLLREARALLPLFTTAEAIGDWSEKVERFAARHVIDVPASAPVAGEAQAEKFIQAAIDQAPEPLRRLGEYLSRVLDEDQWTTAERMLLGACYAAPQACEAVPTEPLRVFSAGMWTYDGTGQAFSHTELDEAAFVTYRAALSAQPGAQKNGGSDGNQ